MTAIEQARHDFEVAWRQFRGAQKSERGYYGHLLRKARWKMERAERVVKREPMPYGRNGK